MHALKNTALIQYEETADTCYTCTLFTVIWLNITSRNKTAQYNPLVTILLKMGEGRDPAWIRHCPINILQGRGKASLLDQAADVYRSIQYIFSVREVKMKSL